SVTPLVSANVAAHRRATSSSPDAAPGSGTLHLFTHRYGQVNTVSGIVKPPQAAFAHDRCHAIMCVTGCLPAERVNESPQKVTFRYLVCAAVDGTRSARGQV